MKAINSVAHEEAVAHVSSLSLAIQQFISDQGVPVGTALNALIASYLAVADATGRLHEVPPLMLEVAETIARQLAATPHH